MSCPAGLQPGSIRCLSSTNEGILYEKLCHLHLHPSEEKIAETTEQIGLVFCWASVKVFAQCINIFEGKIRVQPGKVALLGILGMLQKSSFPKTRHAGRTFGRLVPAHPGPDSHHHPNQTW